MGLNIGLSRSECAAWVQAWGSIAGIGAGAVGVWWQAMQARRAAQAQRDAEVDAQRNRVVALLQQVMLLGVDQLESCNKGMRAAVVDGNVRLEEAAKELRFVMTSVPHAASNVALEGARMIEKVLADYSHLHLHSDLPSLGAVFHPLINDGLRLLGEGVRARDAPVAHQGNGASARAPLTDE